MANFNLNKSIIGGRMTAEPELKQTANGVMVLSFTVAVNRRAQPKTQDGQPTQTIADFINCVAWRERAEFIARYFHKGSSICVAGQLQTRTWTDAQNNKRFATELVVDETFFVDSKSDSAQAAQIDAGAASAMMSLAGVPNFEVLSDDEEVPF